VKTPFTNSVWIVPFLGRRYIDLFLLSLSLSFVLPSDTIDHKSTTKYQVHTNAINNKPKLLEEKI